MYMMNYTMQITWLSVSLWFCVQVVSGCIFGDDANCAFPCNCEDDKDKCDEVTGECHSGCKQWNTTPDKTQSKFHWGGQGCRTGNVALEMNASQSSNYKPLYLADKAVDGRLQTDDGDSSACQHTNKNYKYPWWQVDLGAPHVVYNVTVFIRNNFAFRSRYIKIGVGQTSDITQHQVCVTSNQSIDVSVTLTCSQPLTGRYVSVVRYDGNGDKILNMCEVIVMGHSILNADCSRCSNDTFTCNNIVGCRKCNGYLPPLCTQVCTSGTFGVNCGSSCATHHCINGADTCNHLDGSCPDGCLDWYLNETCTLYIEIPHFDGTSNVEAIVIGDHSVQLTWKPAVDMTPGLDWHYGYIIQYRIEDEYNDVSVVKHKTAERNYTVLAEDLEPSTQYSFRVSVYRQFGDNIAISASLTVDVKTPCRGCRSAYGVIAGAVAAGVLFVVVVVVVIVLWRRRSHKLQGASSDSVSSEPWSEMGIVNPVEKPGAARKTNRNHTERVIEPSQSEMDSAIDGTEGDCQRVTPASGSAPPQRSSLLKNSSVKSTYLSVSGLRSHIEQLSTEFQTEISTSDGKTENVTMDGFEVEFKKLPGDNVKSRTFGQLPQHKTKNRFKNIQPFDDSRVVLQNDGEVEVSDYINASYITRYNDASIHYIASQGPLKETVVDFWRMVWEQKSHRIVMLAQLVENGKHRCEQYWPESIGRSAATKFGPFIVTLLDQHVHADYARRRFKVELNGKAREVYHFHFLSWPDKSVPDNKFPLLALRGRVNRLLTDDHSPLVVHCSAGVGRTGTYIALDYLLNQVRCEGKVDVFGCVYRMRTQRMRMVQTNVQYKFLYTALMEGIDTRVDETAIPCINFIDEYHKLSSESDYSNTNQLMEQFEVMRKNKPSVNMSKHSSALAPENINKNRCEDILPDDRFRPRLSTPHSDGNDYINAVLLDSFDKVYGIILTQAPLPNTVVDFWRLVYDHDCSCIVMLDDADQDDKSCPQYWPPHKAQKHTYGPITVELTNVDIARNANVVCREFWIGKETKSTMLHNAPRKMLRQFQVLNWQGEQGDAVRTIEDMITTWQFVTDASCEKGKTIVHCRDGATHCGLFAACWYILDLLKAEQEVDAFLASRFITSRCPQALSTQEQYYRLYELAKFYISGFQTYANI